MEACNEIESGEERSDDLTLNATPAPMDQANLAESTRSCREQVFERNIPRLRGAEGMKIDRVLDRQLDRSELIGFVEIAHCLDIVALATKGKGCRHSTRT